MRRYVLAIAAAGTLLPLAVGCSKNSQIVRGQAPGEAYMMPPGGAMYCPPGSPCPQYGPGPMGYPPDGCHVGDLRNFPGAPSYPRLECGPLVNPVHGYDVAYKMKYREPQNLVYPPAGDEPAVVQYPYYTVKGPDCFFH